MSKLELSEIYTDYSAFATQKNEFQQGRLLFMTSLFALHYMDPVNLSLLWICQKGDHVCGLRHLGDINSQECLPPINSSAGTQFVSTFLPGEKLPDVKQQKRLINYLFPIGTGRRTHKHTPVAFNYRHSLGRRLRRPAPPLLSTFQSFSVAFNYFIKVFFSFRSFVLRLVCAYTCTSVYLYVRRKQNQTFRTEFMKVADWAEFSFFSGNGTVKFCGNAGYAGGTGNIYGTSIWEYSPTGPGRRFWKLCC